MICWIGSLGQRSHDAEIERTFESNFREFVQSDGQTGSQRNDQNDAHPEDSQRKVMDWRKSKQMIMYSYTPLNDPFCFAFGRIVGVGWGFIR